MMVTIESSSGNTIVARDVITKLIVQGGWESGGTLASRIQSRSGKCAGCSQNRKYCDGVEWVSGTGVFHKSQHSTISPKNCPMVGDTFEIDFKVA